LFNKLDLVASGEARRLKLRRQDVATVSATDRKTTRDILRQQARATRTMIDLPSFEGAESRTTLGELRSGTPRRPSARSFPG
jgi:hypothetical protein